MDEESTRMTSCGPHVKFISLPRMDDDRASGGRSSPRESDDGGSGSGSDAGDVELAESPSVALLPQHEDAEEVARARRSQTRRELRESLDRASGLMMCSGLALIVFGIANFITAVSASPWKFEDQWPLLLLSPVYVVGGVWFLHTAFVQRLRNAVWNLAATAVVVLLHYSLSFAGLISQAQGFMSAYSAMCGVVVVFGGSWCTTPLAVSLFMLPCFCLCFCCLYRSYRVSPLGIGRFIVVCFSDSVLTKQLPALDRRRDRDQLRQSAKESGPQKRFWRHRF
jgi:hypothetical protein